MRFTWDEIWSIMFARRTGDAPLFRQMIDIRDRYNAKVVIPIRNADEEPELPQLAPQLIHDGIENTALRAAMALPQIAVPALEPGKDKGVRSEEYAAIRRRWLYATWDFSLFPLLAGRAYRQLCGYGTFASVVMPDYEFERASIELRDPLTSYPSLRNPGDMRPPRNVGFIYTKSTTTLAAKYGHEIFDVIGRHPDGDGMWDCVEWIDENDIVIGVLGPRSMGGFDIQGVPSGGGRGVELMRYPNRAGMVPVACPRRVTLDTIAGQMDSVTGTADWLDRLMALNVLAAEKNIFPDMYVLGNEFMEPEIVGGSWKDGRTGEINQVRGASAIGQLVSTTGPMTQAVVSQLERAGRMGGGVIPQYGGEAPGSLRTGRAIDTLGAFSVDPRVKELQDIMSAALARSINPSVIEVEKGYWPKKKYVVFSGWPGDSGHVEYVPSRHGETTDNAVAYAFPGTDVSQISVGVLQLSGGELMSKKTARIKHPMIDDADAEADQILVERLEAGIMASLQQQIAGGALPAIDAANLLKLIKDGEHLNDAVIKADEAARARQAAEVPEAPEGQARASEEVPGLSLPGAGAEAQPPPSIQRLPEGQTNLRDLLRAVRTR